MTHQARTPLLNFSMLIALVALLGAVGWPACAKASAASLPAATKAAAADARPDGEFARAEAPEPALPDQYGMSVEYGYTYDPSAQLTFLLARVFAIYDYGTVWRIDRPKALRFKVEGAIGSTLTPENDLIASANMLALYYPVKLTGASLRPYLEAGIGIIYTQFRVPGQGLHVNFNPLLGIGCELPQANGKHPFAAIRLHHLSNAEIDHDNRGVNSVELQIGRYF